ncbi:MAG: hypothetical protein FWH00_01885 [Oscillospiraceae bacterium]|nr:hypothetical protein [Oscillospiraceae bacterium]
MVQEGDKVKLISGEIAIIAEVLDEDVAYIAEIFAKGGGVSIDQIAYSDIKSVFKEVEHILTQAG